MTDERRITVLVPEVGRRKMAPDEPPPARPRGMPATPRFEPSSVNLAKRLDTLENKTLYLVDIGFGGGHNFMLQVRRWFAEHMPSVTTVVRRKPGHVFSDTDNELWKEIKAKGDAVVIGVAG